MAKSNTPNHELPKDTDLKGLESAIKKLNKMVSRTADFYSVANKGNLDLAKSLGAQVESYDKIVESYDRIASMQKASLKSYQAGLQATTSNLKLEDKLIRVLEKKVESAMRLDQGLDDINGTTKKIVDQFVLENKHLQLTEKFVKGLLSVQQQRVLAERSHNALLNSNTVLTEIQQRYAEVNIQNNINTFASGLKNKNLTQGMLDLEFRRVQITQLQKSILDSKATNLKKQSAELASQLEQLNEAIILQRKIDDIEHSQTAELEKQKVLHETTSNLGDKILGSFGESTNEVFEIGNAIKHSMISPLALVGALVGNALDEWSKIGKSSRGFLDITKLTVNQTEHLRDEAHHVALSLRDQGVTMDKVFNAQAGLLSQYGSMNRLTDEAVLKVTQLEKGFGISAENAAGVVYQLQKTSGLSAEAAGNISALAAAFAQSAGVAPDAIMQDIAQSTDAIATNFKGTAVDLLRTSVEARRLGLNIQKVADISKAILTFESSIEDQMTASVLLGKEINLDKARALALDGKILEAAEETIRQVGTLANFNKMNAIQKEAIAKAAGMTVGDLQQSLEKSEAIKNMTAGQRMEYEKGLQALKGQNALSAEKLLKDQKNQLVQEKLSDAMSKLADVFANVILPVLQPFVWILTKAGNLLGGLHVNILRIAAGLFLVKKIGLFKNMFTNAGLLIGKIKAFTMSLFTNTKAIGLNASQSILKNNIDKTSSFMTAAKAGNLTMLNTQTAINTAVTDANAASTVVQSRAQRIAAMTSRALGVAATGATGAMLGFGAALIEVGTGVLLIGSGIGIAAAGIGVAAMGFAQLVTAVSGASEALVYLIKNVEFTQLLKIAAGLSAIGTSLAILSVTGLAALPVLTGIAAVGLATNLIPIGNSTTTTPSPNNSDNSDIIEKLDELKNALVSAITADGDIRLDAKKVGEVLGIKTQKNYRLT